MEVIGAVILGFIAIVFIIMLIVGIMSSINRLSNSVEYKKATKKSTGLEKIRLLVRGSAPTFTSQLRKVGSSQRSDLTAPIWTSYIFVADGFYYMMKDAYDQLGGTEAFDSLAETISTNFNKLDAISARIFGIAFGVVITKAANTSGKNIRKAKVIEYLNSCEFDERYKKEITKMVKAYIDFEQDKLFGAHSKSGGFTSHDLGIMAYALLDEKLSKEDYPDPTISTSMSMAIAIAYKETVIYDSLIRGLNTAGLIS